MVVMMKGGRAMASLQLFLMISFMLIMSISRTLADQEQSVDQTLTPFVETGSSNSITTTGAKPQGFFSVKKCKKAIGNIDDCVWSIYKSYVHNDHKFARPCCETLADLGLECIKLRATNIVAALLPPVIKFACGFIPDSVALFTTTDFTGSAGARKDRYSSSTSSTTSNINKVAPAGADEFDHLSMERLDSSEFDKCISGVRRLEGCSAEVVTSIVSLQYQIIGPACCQAIIEINGACWSQIVPSNPFFPPLLRGHCVSLLQAHNVEPPTSSIPPV